MYRVLEAMPRIVRTKFCSVSISGPPPDSELKFEVMTEHKSHCCCVVQWRQHNLWGQNQLLKMRIASNSGKRYIC